MIIYQQGDVVLSTVLSIPSNLIESKESILQHGEATGHAHRLYGDGFTVFEDKKANKRYLRLLKETQLRHEEHNEIKLPSGDYEVRIVREYNHWDEEASQVAD